MATIKKISGYDLAFLKLYFVNLTSGHKFQTFYQAEITGNKAAKIASKLTGEELSYLIDKIEGMI